jgi:hypothetical protein
MEVQNKNIEKVLKRALEELRYAYDSTTISFIQSRVCEAIGMLEALSTIVEDNELKIRG